MKKSLRAGLGGTLVAAAGLMAAASAGQAQSLRENWCEGVHLRFFAGGAEGDAFASIVYNGAKQAQADLGADVDYIFSGWDSERMVQQLREAVASKPQGIAMMGHPGDAAILTAGRGSRRRRHQDDVPERAGERGRRQVRRRLCRCPAGGAGPRARRRGGAAGRAAGRATPR